ncbi:hypothetical protein [Methylorubrum suomiense]|uniref:Uncharacterized protein n=1 Tax=Methylorubrum suomiense TaxID=144191 RepID=A0ABQ4V2A5_9HYPH|nr:hypothetical protein [Methylorubrum suomiense]GJE77477.1 hypothetical protein BGCPKDLD_4082 [Methylorubrum suomiense]
MSAPEAQPVSTAQAARIVDLCDRALAQIRWASYSDLVARIEDLERLAALRYGQVYALTFDHEAVAQGIHRNTEASLEEAIERAASAARRGASFLLEANARPDLSEPPANVVLFAAHRIQVAAGRP